METLLIWGILGLLLGILLSIFALLVYSGLFYNIQISTGRPPIGEIVVAYKFGRGPYKDAGHLFSEVVRLAPYKKTIGIYYDDPKQVSTNKTRYIIGAILAENGALPNEQLKTTLKEKEYTIARFPEVSHAVKTMFPFKCTLSIFIALIRVYPLLGSYLKDRRLCAHPILEVYDDCNIHFIAPLAKQNEFYVPEAQASEEDEGSDEDGSVSAMETSKSYSNDSTSEISHRSLSTLSNVASDVSTNNTATTECEDSSPRDITESPQSDCREKSLTPAEDITPLFAKSKLSPGSVEDDQEWENLENFKAQEEEDEVVGRVVGSVSNIQETTLSPFTIPTQESSLPELAKPLHRCSSGGAEGEEAAPVVIEASLQESMSSRLEESGFSESLLSTLQDSGLGSEVTASPHPIITAASANTVNESCILPNHPEQPQPLKVEQQQQQQLVEIESDTGSEHSNSSSSYEEVKLTEINDA